MPDLETPDLPDEDEFEDPNIPSRMNEPLVEIEHSSLVRYNDSFYKRDCPWCDNGVFLVRRHQETHEIIAEDRCIGCAQLVRYTDIDKLKGSDLSEFRKLLTDLSGDERQEDQKKTPEESGEPDTTKESKD